MNEQTDWYVLLLTMVMAALATIAVCLILTMHLW